MESTGSPQTCINLFENQDVRSVWNEADHQYYYCVSDVVRLLTDSIQHGDNIKRMRKRDSALNAAWGSTCCILDVVDGDGKSEETECASQEAILRIIQSISSPKADYLKAWLAEVAVDCLEEIRTPELAAKRIHTAYRACGYNAPWIDLRLFGMGTHDKLISEWEARGVRDQFEQSTLISAISQETFGMTPAQYLSFKGLDSHTEVLRDHMTDMELILSMLGELATREIARDQDAMGYSENLEVAISGGTIAGNTRRNLEQVLGRSVMSPESSRPKRSNPELI